MKQKNFTKCLRHLALLTLMILGIGNAWGAEKTITLTHESFSLKTSYAVCNATVDGVSFTVNQGYKGTQNKQTFIQMNSTKGSGILYNTTPITGLKSITVNVAGGTKTYTVTTGTSVNPTTTAGSSGETSTISVATAGDTYFQLKVSGASYFSSIVITYEGNEQAATPTFSVSAGTFFDSFDLELACTTQDAKILYTLDGSTPSAESAEYTAPLTISETTTVKAIAVKAGIDTSYVASATYTLGKIYASLADLVAAGAPTTTGETVRVTLTDETITKKANNGIFLQSGAREVQIYCYNVPDTFAVGGTVSGTLTCPWKLFNTTWELCPSNWNDLTFKASTKTVATINLSTYQSQLTVGGEDKITVHYNGDGTLSATSSAEGVATVSFSTVDSVLTVKALAAGTTTITISAPETETYGAAAKSYTLIVSAPAELPFSFNGGRADIAGTDGMTALGLNPTDYKTENTKLKFSSTGATLVINFNAQPTSLVFAIRGNSFSGGTFDVLASENGTNYSTLQSFTSLSGSDSIVGMALNDDVRYVKFVYTNKANGNVGLGYITISNTQPANMTIAATNKWATFYAPFAVDVPKNVYAYAITVNGSNEAVRTKVGGDEAYTLPAETPVLVYCDDEGGFSKTFFDGQSTGTPVEVSANSLVGTSVALNPIPDPEAGMTNYVLQNGANGIAWYAVVNSNSLPANRAYLSVTTNVDVKGCLDDETGIANVDANVDANANVIYNLAGQRVNKLQNGINIVNGKKILK